MAELLTVIAILAILMALVGVGVYNYLRDLKLTEYDNAAKSIYIAAQNSITDLQASGEWAARESTYAAGMAQNPTAPRTDDEGKTQGDDALYYYVSADFAQKQGILPAGSIEAQVWDGSYVIEYRYDTGTVYGVFFTEGSQEDLESFYATGTGTNIRDRGVRRGNDPLVGYYGGAAATNLESVTLQEPVVNAGRSSVLAVTDPNLATGIDAMETVMLVTIQKGALDGEAGEGAGETGGEEAAKPLKLMLSRGTGGGVSVRIIEDGQATLPIHDDFVTLSGEPSNKNTYSIDLALLKANDQTAPFLTDLAPGDEYRVMARVTTSQKLCRPAYGYGIGVWPSDDEDVVFTSNIIADYEREADLYVYRDETNLQGDGVVFNLENWYNDLTQAGEDLFYRIVPDARISIVAVQEYDTQAGDDVQAVNGFYAFPFVSDKQRAHQVTFDIPGIASLEDGTTLDMAVNAYRKNGALDEPATDLSKTLVIHVHVMNQRPFGWYVEDHGSYAEVVVTAGTKDTGALRVASNVANAVSDESNPLVTMRANAGRLIELSSIPAGGSASVKFFKTDTGMPLSSGNFVVGPT